MCVYGKKRKVNLSVVTLCVTSETIKVRVQIIHRQASVYGVWYGTYNTICDWYVCMVTCMYHTNLVPYHTTQYTIGYGIVWYHIV